ncbi:unnamed protein product [Victoria cruziana]
MVFNSLLVVNVARWSTDFFRFMAWNPQNLTTEELLAIICCLPLHQLSRVATCLWSFFCYPHPDFYISSDDDDDDRDSDSGSD